MGDLFRPSPLRLDPLGVGRRRRRALSRWATRRRVSRRAGHDRRDPVVYRLDDEAGHRPPHPQPAQVGRRRLSPLQQRPRGHDDHRPFLGAPVTAIRRRRPDALRIPRDPAPHGRSPRDGDLRLGIRRAGHGRAAQALDRARRVSHRLTRRRRAWRSRARAPGPDDRRTGARGRRHARLGSGVRASHGRRAGAVGRADRALAGGRGRAARSAGPHHPGGRGSGRRGARYGAPGRSRARRDSVSGPAEGRWRRSAGIALVASRVLVLVAVRWASGRAERALALRVAAATAGYLALVARAARGSADYDLSRLLIEARALDGLPGFAAPLEVFHGTAPLVHATARPLSPALFDRLRRHAAAQSTGSAALAPLFDRDGWDVVGAVAAWPARTAWLSWRSTLAMLPSLVAGALAAAAVGGAAGRSRRAVTWFAGAATVFGLAAYGDIRAAARDATDRWLGDARLLMQEGVERGPQLRWPLSAVAPIARGTEVIPGGSEASAPWVHIVAGTPRAAVAVRLAPGRWAELRAAPEEGEGWMAGWLAVTVGLALLGPLAVAFAAWGEHAAARPRQLRETVAAWGFLAPSALHLGVFSFAPILFVLYLSVHRWTLVDPARPFVGLAN